MSTERIAGNNWRNARLLFDNVAQAENDPLLVLGAPNEEGVFSGHFRHPETDEQLPDELVDGRCTPNGLRPQIVFTRIHPGGTVTTTYTGKVIEVAGETTVMIRGRFTRTTTTAPLSDPVSASGDYETEKPT